MSLEKHSVDDDRWKHVCKRIRRVEIFLILIVVWSLFFSDGNTNVWNGSSCHVNQETSPVVHDDTSFVDYAASATPKNPKIEQKSKIHVITNNKKNNEQRNLHHAHEPFDSTDPVEREKFNMVIKDYIDKSFHAPKHQKRELTSRNRNGKAPLFVDKYSQNVDILSNDHIEENNRQQGSVNAHISTNWNQVTEVYQSKNESQYHSELNITRDLQLENANTTCNGTLFHLEIHLDPYAEETAWELTQMDPPNVVAFVNYTSDASQKLQTYTTCLAHENYSFTLYDSWGDGIDCWKDSCFSISLNNKVEFSNLEFSSGELALSFDTSKECSAGALFEVEVPSVSASDSSWTLSRVIHDQKNQGLNLIQDAIDYGETKRFNTCISPGTYLLEGQNVYCDDCYKVFINGELIRQGKDFLGTDRHKFYVSPLGKGYEQHCDKLPQLIPTSFVNNFVFDEAIERKLDAIYSLASMDTITNDPFSPQYQAACWVIFDDKVAYTNEEDSSNSSIMIDDEFKERYILALFFFATEQDIEKLHAKTCEYDKVRVSCKENRITKMDFCKYF